MTVIDPFGAPAFDPASVATEPAGAAIPRAYRPEPAGPSGAAAPDPGRADGGAAAAEGGAGEVERQAALRALRSLEATEARLERNAKREVDEARGKLVLQLLPVLDNLDRTIDATQAHRSDPAMLEGVRMVRHQLEGVLRGYGVERIEATDQAFDPALHEAIGVTPVHDPRRHGIVVHQAEPGYRMTGKLLRPARVTVGKLVAPVDVAPRALWR